MILTRKAFLSGFFAATSSCVAKLCLQSKSWIPTTVGNLCMEYFLDDEIRINSAQQTCENLSLLSRIISLLLVIVLNGLMMSMFLDGLEESGSISATALSTAANFSFSAALGVLFFKESISFQWLAGFVTVLLGVSLLSSIRSVPPATSK